ncbi:MAG: histidinol-phosphatase [Proteobacteria bacterium]|nr:histidinol-phosphatase [Pseudomonadota bacterium]MBU1708456.1 histidinol-phosphatase [Pseudomonadota bacterium]
MPSTPRPLINNAFDGHMHSKLCGHAVGEMEEYVVAAIDKGLSGINFLEHLEIDIRYFEKTWLSDAEFSYYVSEGKRLKNKYKSQIQVGTGIEVGFNPNRVPEIKTFLDTYDWDLIGISYHFLDTAEKYHLNMVSSKKQNLDAALKYGPEKIVLAYYEGLRQAASILPGTVLCHLDAVLRFLPEIPLTNEIWDRIMDVLDVIKNRGMALEVNTSGYRIRDEPFPAIRLLREAVRREIPLSLGSDAHKPGDVGRYFHRLPELAEQLRDDG